MSIEIGGAPTGAETMHELFETEYDEQVADLVLNGIREVRKTEREAYLRREEQRIADSSTYEWV